MIFLRVLLLFIIVSCAGAKIKQKSRKPQAGAQGYEFNLKELDFTKGVNLLSSYRESSSTWAESTWRSVEEANKPRMVLIQCLKDPASVNLNVFDKLREKYAENFNYWLDKGICQYQQESYPQAYFSFEFARQFADEKQKKQIDQWIGGIYFKQGYWRKAIDLWRSSKLPNSYQWDTAFARMFNGQSRKSEAYFTKLIEAQQINDSLLLAMAHIYVERSEFGKTQEMLLKVSKKGKKVRKSYFFLQAYLLKKSGRLEDLKKFAKRVPKSYQAEMQEFIKI